KGGRSINWELLAFCRTLGGSPRQILWRVRIPAAASWTFAALPNAVSFSLIGVVLAEFVGSTTGMGYLMISALATLNATDMFAAVILLSVVGIMLVSVITTMEKRVMHWSAERSEEHTSELQSRFDIVCRLLLEKKNKEKGRSAAHYL